MDLQSIADEVKAAQDAGRQIAPLTGRVNGFDSAAAYEVARLVHEARVREGASPVGRKIGFTNREIWPVYGVYEPIWAHVYDTTVVRLGASPGACRIGRFCEPRLEPEIVLHFAAAPPVGGDPRAILECVDWIAHGLEVVQTHFPGWKFQAADTVADSSLHATLLVGEPQPVERLGPDLPSRLERLTVTLFCGAAPRARGRGANALGSPLAAVAHLTGVLAKQPGAQPLAAGELVTTGTLTDAFPIRAGETWRTDFEGIALRGLSVTFSA
jgi:2-oxo-3-hexenedioate decarboxylase